MTNSFLLTVGSTMGNHLWQTSVAAAAIWLLNLLLYKNPARIRYSLWLAASAEVSASVLSTDRLGQPAA